LTQGTDFVLSLFVRASFLRSMRCINIADFKFSDRFVDERVPDLQSIAACAVRVQGTGQRASTRRTPVFERWRMLISQGQFQEKADRTPDGQTGTPAGMLAESRQDGARRDGGPMRWVLPLAHWAAWSGQSDGTPDLKFIDLMLRRRLSALSKMAMKVAHDCAGERPAIRVLFASRHGELNRTTAILDDIVAGEPVSPTAFSLSVLNAMPGVMSIARHDRSTSVALSAGPQTLGYALLEAYTQYRESPGTPLLLVYAHEPAGQRYGPVDDDPERGALALLFEAQGAHELDCEFDTRDFDGQPTGHPSFATQSRALLHSLSTLSATTWQVPRARWSWHCHVRAH
jgi:Beta-ketoacyl synthase, N-terminal domain